MGVKYSTVALSAYNSSPPPDDGSQAASNLVTWSGIKTKIGDPLKTQVAAVDAAVVAALNTSCRAISSNDNVLAADHWKTLEVTNGAVITLLDAATAAAGFTTKIVNVGTSVVRITRTTGADFINGVAIDLNLSPGDSVTLTVNAAANGYVVDSGNNVDVGACQGRLSAHPTQAVPTSDVSSSTSVFFIPYGGNKIALFDGTGTWSKFRFGIASVACPTTSSTPFDVFAFNNAGVVALETATWTNSSSRATGITLQDGVLVKVGATTRRYLGTCCTIATPGNIEDTIARRYVWNYYNRVSRPMRRLEATDTWTYTTAAFQQANANAANQLDFVIGVAEDLVSAQVKANARNDNAGGGVNITVGIGLDATNALAAGCINNSASSPAANFVFNPGAEWRGYPGIGRHVLTWVEHSVATGTTTWLGDNSGVLVQSGIHGEVRG